MAASAPQRAPLQVNRDLSTQGEGARVTTPAQVSVWVGLDVGEETHFADVLDNDGERLFVRAIGNDQGDIEARASKRGVPGLVTDQPGSITQRSWRWPPSGAPLWPTCPCSSCAVLRT